MRMIRTVHDAVEELGGNKVLAHQIGLVPSAVANWKLRGGIPAAWFLPITHHLGHRGARVSPEIFHMRGARNGKAARRA